MYHVGLYVTTPTHHSALLRLLTNRGPILPHRPLCQSHIFLPSSHIVKPARPWLRHRIIAVKGQLITEHGTFLSDEFHTMMNRQLNVFNYVAFVFRPVVIEMPSYTVLQHIYIYMDILSKAWV
jgi:hypothetical protein